MDKIIKLLLPVLFFIIGNTVQPLQLFGQFSKFSENADMIIKDDIFGGDYEFIAGVTIRSDRIISEGADVHFIAGEAIKLTKGFKVDRNCHFKAHLVQYNKTLPLSNENIHITNNFFNVYPSVSDGIICFELYNKYDGCTIHIYNSSGMLVYSEDYKRDGKMSIDLTGVPKGIYMVRAKINEESQLKKIVIK
jgi:hypothetical protein